MELKPASKAFAAFLALGATIAAAADKPVKVYILSGQSNIVGIGQMMAAVCDGARNSAA
jgi:hypothetical protein